MKSQGDNTSKNRWSTYKKYKHFLGVRYILI
jgi:hypothetical protein